MVIKLHRQPHLSMNEVFAYCIVRDVDLHGGGGTICPRFSLEQAMQSSGVTSTCVPYTMQVLHTDHTIIPSLPTIRHSVQRRVQYEEIINVSAQQTAVLC